MKMKLGLLSLLLIVTLIGVNVHAADHSAVVPLVTDDVVAIGYLDLTAIDMSSLLKEMRDLGALPHNQQEDAASGVAKAKRWIKELVDSGVTRAYVLLRQSDLQYQGPTWVLSLTDEADSDAVIRTLPDSFDKSPRPAFMPHDFQVVDGAVLAAMNEAQMERLATRRVGEPREKVMAALAELGAGDAISIVLGDADSRRVLREMFPSLPAPFHSIDGRMIADDLLWGGVAVDLPPQPKVTIHIQTSGLQVAKTLQQTAVRGLELATQQLLARVADPQVQVSADGITHLLGLFKPRIEGPAVKLTWSVDTQAIAHLRDLLTSPTTGAREQAQNDRRIKALQDIPDR